MNRLFTFLLSLFILLLGVVFFFNARKDINQPDLLKKEFKDIYYELKKCYLFKKYCFINSPKTYKILKIKMEGFKYNENCLKKMKCKILSQQDKIGISYIVKQSQKLNIFRNVIGNTHCSIKQKDNVFNYISYLSLSASLIERNEKKEIFNTLNLKNNLETIRLDLLNCSKEN
jgi:antitoxin component HigA of HigAB toxin-antitoxin module